MNYSLLPGKKSGPEILSIWLINSYHYLHLNCLVKNKKIKVAVQDKLISSFYTAKLLIKI